MKYYTFTLLCSVMLLASLQSCENEEILVPLSEKIEENYPTRTIYTPKDINEFLNTAEGVAALKESGGDSLDAFANLLTESLIEDVKGFEKSSLDEFLVRSHVLGKDKFGNLVGYTETERCSGPCVTNTSLQKQFNDVFSINPFRCFSFVNRTHSDGSLETLIHVGRVSGSFSCNSINSAGIYANTSASLSYDGVNTPVVTATSDWGCLEFEGGGGPFGL